jgi:hypothetical protein
MAQPQSKSSSLNELCTALPSLPMRLQEVGRFVAANDYDVTTRSMRELASAGADPASAAKRRLEATELRLAAMSQYVAERRCEKG